MHKAEYKRIIEEHTIQSPKKIDIEKLRPVLGLANNQLKEVKAVLVNTSSTPYVEKDQRGVLKPDRRIPLGLYHIKASAEEVLGKDRVAVIDMDRYQLLPADASDLIGFLNKETGTSLPVGVNMFHTGRSISVETAKRIADLGNPVVFGGRGTTIEKGELVEEIEGGRNAGAILGDGELMFLQFVQNGIHSLGTNIVTLENVTEPPSETYFTGKKLSEFPLPQYPTYKAHRGKGEPYHVGITSRSCPRDCSFCAAKKGNQYRVYPITWIENYLRSLKPGKDGKIRIEFNDDNVWGNINRAEKFTDLLERLSAEGIEFVYRILARGDTVVKAAEIGLLDRAKAVGLEEIDMGVESRNNEILSRMNKGETAEQIGEAAESVLRKGILLKAFTMIGYHGESRQQMQETVNWLYTMRKEFGKLFGLSFFIAAPYQGTRLSDDLTKKGYGKWDLQLVTEALVREDKGLLKEADNMKIKISELSFLELLDIFNGVNNDLYHA